MSNADEFAKEVVRRLDDSLLDLPPGVEQALANRRRNALHSHKPYWSLALAASVLAIAIAWPMLKTANDEGPDYLDNATASLLMQDDEPQMLEDLDMLEALAEVADDQT